MSTSSSECYVASWENFIENDGSVFYAEYTNINEQNNFNKTNKNCTKLHNECLLNNRNTSPRNSTKKIGDKIIRLINSTTSTSLGSSYVENLNKNSMKKVKSITKPLENNLNEKLIQVELVIPQPNNYQSKRYANLIKLLSGLETSTLPDKRLVVTGFQHNSRLEKEKDIQIGDLLITVNKKKVNSKNIYDVLSKCIHKKSRRILMQFQRIEKEKFNSFSIKQIKNFENFTKNFPLFIKNVESDDAEDLIKFSLIILRNSEKDDTIFCYPKKEKNIFYNAKGSFLTLISILKNEFNTQPINTTLSHNGNTYLLCYSFLNDMLILIFVPTSYLTKKEANLLMELLTNFLKLSYSQLQITDKQKLEFVCQILERLLMNCKIKYIFENLLSEQKQFFLPKEAQLKIVDALSEMEAMDYRDWIQEPLNSHREYFIAGSCLFYNKYLLFNSLNISILKSLKSLLMLKGIFTFSDSQNIKDFIHWTEIFLNSKNRNYLTICIKNNLMLCVILQTLQIKTNNENKVQPPVFYIEEIQETLDHLGQLGGIDALAKVWKSLNKRPETIAHILGTPSEYDDNDFTRIQGSSEFSAANSALSVSNVQEESDSDEDWNGFPKNHKTYNGFDISELKKSFMKEVQDILPIVVTVGKQNVLINYVQIDYGNGIVMSSMNNECNFMNSTFKSACQIIHSILDNAKRSYSSTSNCKNLFTVTEHGILQTIKDDNGNKKQFWIIGRLLDSFKELYVCHSSDMPQNLVEIGFRLSYLTDG